MATTEITAQNFESLITKPGIAVLDWWAAWCGPCRAFAPTFEAASQKHTDILWGKVDTEAQQELAAAFAIRSIPTLMIFRDGVLLFAQPGMLPASALDELVEGARALDMDEVRKKLDEEEKKEAEAELKAAANQPAGDFGDDDDEATFVRQ
ncbi:MAG: thiol reductase thioredoxin [Deltaproteobacteria bacterium]|nr:thiol reductase thioredoxin [Deltaproteobacteria bacterium]